MSLAYAEKVVADKAKKGGDAFPNKWGDGMSLRDWFAGQAIAAISSRWSGRIGDIDEDAARITAQKAYSIADAMLKARISKPEPEIEF